MTYTVLMYHNPPKSSFVPNWVMPHMYKNGTNIFTCQALDTERDSSVRTNTVSMSSVVTEFEYSAVFVSRCY